MTEVCDVEFREDERLGDTVYWWEARKNTGFGELLILKGQEYRDPRTEDGGLASDFLGHLGDLANRDLDDIQMEEEFTRRLHLKENELFVSAMQKDGWEAVASSDEGYVVKMTRS